MNTSFLSDNEKVQRPLPALQRQCCCPSRTISAKLLRHTNLRTPTQNKSGLEERWAPSKRLNLIIKLVRKDLSFDLKVDFNRNPTCQPRHPTSSQPPGYSTSTPLGRRMPGLPSVASSRCRQTTTASDVGFLVIPLQHLIISHGESVNGWPELAWTVVLAAEDNGWGSGFGRGQTARGKRGQRGSRYQPVASPQLAMIGLGVSEDVKTTGARKARRNGALSRCPALQRNLPISTLWAIPTTWPWGLIQHTSNQRHVAMVIT